VRRQDAECVAHAPGISYHHPPAAAQTARNASLDAGSLEQVIAMEDRNPILCTRTSDVAEGVAAFLQKRPPQYADR